MLRLALSFTPEPVATRRALAQPRPRSRPSPGLISVRERAGRAGRGGRLRAKAKRSAVILSVSLTRCFVPSLPTPGRERPAVPPHLAQLPHCPSGPCCGWRAGERREDTFPNHFKPRKTPPVLTSLPLHPGKGFRAVPPFPGKPLARGGVGVPGCHRGAPVAAA